MKDLYNLFEGLFDVDDTVEAAAKESEYNLDWVKNKNFVKVLLELTYGFNNMTQPFGGLTLKDYPVLCGVCDLLEQLPDGLSGMIKSAKTSFNNCKHHFDKVINDYKRINKYAAVIAILDKYSTKRGFGFLEDRDNTLYRFVVRPKERMILDFSGNAKKENVEELFNEIKKLKGFRDITFKEISPVGIPEYIINIFV